jgi:hypothetical protein
MKDERFYSVLQFRMDACDSSLSSEPGAGILISEMGLLHYHLIQRAAELRVSFGVGSSDSTRTARERAREATCGHRLRRPGPVLPGQASFTSESRSDDPRPCGSESTLRCVAPRPRGSTPRCGASRPNGSSLAGVGHRPLAIGHGCLVGLRAGVPDRRPVSPLSSSPACSGAGTGWHCRSQIADSTVLLGGPATLGAGPLLCADSWAVTLWRIASVARLRRSRGHRAERGQPVLSAQHHCGCSPGQVGVRPVPGRSRPGRERCPNWSAPRAPVSTRSPHSLASGSTLLATSSGQWPAHLRQTLADSDAGPGSRNSRPPRPEVTIRHVPIPSPLLALARA